MKRYAQHLWIAGISLLVIISACVPVLTPRTAGPAVGVQSPAGQNNLAAPAQAATTDLRFVATEFRFDPINARVPAGQKVRVTLENKGVVEHDIEIPAIKFHLHAKAGQTVTGELTVDKPGEYEFICTIPGHKGAGMKGTLTVGEAATVAQTTSIPAPVSVAAKPLPANIRPLPAPQIALPTYRNQPATVKVNLETQEVTAQLADGVGYTFWTFNGTVPGPMIRARVGDTINVKLHNPLDSHMVHNIDFHAATGPGGGGEASFAAPGETNTFSFKAMKAGL